jgi:hypothetical protein
MGKYIELDFEFDGYDITVEAMQYNASKFKIINLRLQGFEEGQYPDEDTMNLIREMAFKELKNNDELYF